MHIIDRRLNPSGRSHANRQRFERRAEKAIRQGTNPIPNPDGTYDVEIPSDDSTHEPKFHRKSTGGIRDHLLPGNREYLAGDTIPRPPGGSGGTGSQGSPDGKAKDTFRFRLTKDQYENIVFEGLALPDLEESDNDMETPRYRQAGYSVSGSPANLALMRTVRNSLSRRIALKRPKSDDLIARQNEIEELEQIAEPDADQLAFLEHKRETLLRDRRRQSFIAYIDPLDVRYKHREPMPRPDAEAVMFCLMDVSQSMTEHMKDLAKRFNATVEAFLQTKYPKVHVVYIRFHSTAAVVDKETFYNSPENGGTIISSGLECTNEQIAEFFSSPKFNRYATLSSDGDNTTSDNPKTEQLLARILPKLRRLYYVETKPNNSASPHVHARPTEMMGVVKRIAAGPLKRKIVHGQISDKKEIIPEFRRLFAKDSSPLEAGSVPAQATAFNFG